MTAASESSPCLRGSAGPPEWVSERAPTVTVRAWIEWQVRTEDQRAVAFASDDRASAEKWLHRLLPANGEYVLARVERRTRTESWSGEPQVVEPELPFRTGSRRDGAVGEGGAAAVPVERLAPLPPTVPEETRGSATE